MKKTLLLTSSILARLEIQFKQWLPAIVELTIIVIFAWIYAGGLLDFDPRMLQQSGEHNESATRPLLADYGLRQNGEIPLWNHFMQTGFPHAGDLLGHFWSPIATIPVLIWGGINGMKVSIFISFLLAGLGQWYLSGVIGLKGMFKVWSALMFMFSGGLALLWRVGWYELLVGVVWFPWTFASFWQSLHKQDVTSMVWVAFCASMVLFTGGGYYPFYLGGGVLIILIGAILSNRSETLKIITRAIFIALMIVGVTAVMTMPIYDGYRLIFRGPGNDFPQTGSQPVHYGLINFIVSDPEWFNTTILGALNGWNWFYIGPLSVGSLFFLVFAFRYRKNRAVFITVFTIFAIYMLWSANRYSFFKYIYDLLPFLYSLRFPNRLFIVATSPLLAVSSYSLQSLIVVLRRWFSKYRLTLATPGTSGQILINFRRLANLVMLIVLFFSARDVFETNRGIAIAPAPLDESSYTTLEWLRKYDRGMYYINIGGGVIWWSWLPAAYQMEFPVINFVYSQSLVSKIYQAEPDAPFYAEPKYQISSREEPPINGIMVKDFEYAVLWVKPDALPFAFSTATKNLNSDVKLNTTMVTELSTTYSGPNRVLVQGEPSSNEDTLIVLVSDYPGWKLLIDQQPATLKPVNGYLSTPMLPGNHNYSFIFDPPLHRIGLTISILTLAILIILLVREGRLNIQRQLAILEK